ncbi:MAG: putative DNA binding domain-containing protein [Selenomonadaceae bacterium]|nr:putative DNA binding domain-containing protein [Selenomonadaceae bacterium]
MTLTESDKLELKREITDTIKKEVIAFVNTHGGTIYIGIDDDGTIVGIDDLDGAMLAVGNMLRDAVHPDVMMFVDIHPKVIDESPIMCIKIAEGTNKPYYLKKYGLKPSGVYVRQGSASVQASSEQIRQMIKKSDGDIYEDNISLNQELSFNKTEVVFQANNLKFTSLQQQTLGLLTPNGAYTNLALLLSDQCPFSVKVAVFRGNDQTKFQDRREFSGALFAQLEDCFDFLKLNNPLTARFSGLYRSDEMAYPDNTIREALLNCIVHRDYSFSTDSFISIYQNRMEFTSIGGLLPGVHKDDIMLGLSVCRNKKLADVFYRLDLIEAYGTGLLKIQNAYKDKDVAPEIIVATNSFKVILPSLTYRQ